MQTPSVQASSDVFFQYVDHFLATAEGFGDAEIFTNEQKATIDATKTIIEAPATSLRNAYNARILAEGQTAKIRARYGIRDIVLDMRVMASSDGVLNGLAMRNRQNPLFQSVFQEGSASDITEANIREEPDLADRLCKRIVASPDFDGKQKIVADLSEAITKSMDTRKAMLLAEAAEASLGDQEHQARLKLRIALEQAYNMLRAAFPAQKKLVESFFPKAKPRKKEAAKESTEETGANGR